MTKSTAWMIIAASLFVGVGLGIVAGYRTVDNMNRSMACVWPGIAISTGALGDKALEPALTRLAASDRFNKAEKELLAQSAPCAREAVVELAKMGVK